MSLIFDDLIQTESASLSSSLAGTLGYGLGDRRFSEPNKDRSVPRRGSDSSLADPHMWKRDFDPEEIWGQKTKGTALTMA